MAARSCGAAFAIVLLAVGCSGPAPRPHLGTRVGRWENEAAWRAGYERRRARRQAELDAMQVALDLRAKARLDYAAAHRGQRPADILDAIAAGSVTIGMTHAEVLLVVDGATVRRTATSTGVGEAWDLAGDVRLTMRDAKLVSWSAPGSDPTLSKVLELPQPTVPANDAY